MNNKRLFSLMLFVILVFNGLYCETSSSIEMVFIQGGSFQMGSDHILRDYEGCPLPESTPSPDRPVHKVVISSFYMGKYEVTQKQWESVMNYNPSHFKGENKPVDTVSWMEAVEFCNRLSEKDGFDPVYIINNKDVTCDFSKNGYRLPTEAEWEYAARGGQKGQGYCFSGSDKINDVAWNFYNSEDQTHPVGQKKPNELGLYDMSGNVFEWCWDWYDETYYARSPLNDPSGPDNGKKRTYRGGSWRYEGSSVMVTERGYYLPPSDILLHNKGLRVVRSF